MTDSEILLLLHYLTWPDERSNCLSQACATWWVTRFIVTLTQLFRCSQLSRL